MRRNTEDSAVGGRVWSDPGFGGGAATAVETNIKVPHHSQSSRRRQARFARAASRFYGKRRRARSIARRGGARR
jgi:hypothetical protein